jgi:hypothetical protein
VLPRGLATRAGAALGIIPFGTTAEAWGAATGLRPDRAGNARLIPSPRKHGLELSRDGESTLREPRSKRRKASAPRYGAQPRPRYQQAATFVDAARRMVGMRLSALRLPLIAGGESILVRGRSSSSGA